MLHSRSKHGLHQACIRRQPIIPPDLREKPRRPVNSNVRAAEAGNFGDCEPVGEGVSEMRIHVGPGYRLYYTRRGEVIYLLLVGGDKSEQKRDIKRALEMARKLNEDTK